MNGRPKSDRCILPSVDPYLSPCLTNLLADSAKIEKAKSLSINFNAHYARTRNITPTPDVPLLAHTRVIVYDRIPSAHAPCRRVVPFGRRGDLGNFAQYCEIMGRGTANRSGTVKSALWYPCASKRQQKKTESICRRAGPLGMRQCASSSSLPLTHHSPIPVPIIPAPN